MLLWPFQWSKLLQLKRWDLVQNLKHRGYVCMCLDLRMAPTPKKQLRVDAKTHQHQEPSKFQLYTIVPFLGLYFQILPY